MELFLVLLLFILFLICMKKFNCDFKGIELVIFWLTFTYCIFGKGIGDFYVFPIIFFGIYYLINVIKTKKYIKWYLILIQVIMSIIFLVGFLYYENATCDGMCFGSLILFLIFIGMVSYMAIVNFIVFIIKKITNKEVKSINNKKMNKTSLVLIIISIVLGGFLLFKGTITTTENTLDKQYILTIESNTDGYGIDGNYIEGKVRTRKLKIDIDDIVNEDLELNKSLNDNPVLKVLHFYDEKVLLEVYEWNEWKQIILNYNEEYNYVPGYTVITDGPVLDITIKISNY